MNLNTNIIFGQEPNNSSQISNSSSDSLTYTDNNIISDITFNTQLNLTWTIAIRLYWHIIIAGDFNAVPNSQLDKQSTTRKHHSCNPTNQCITLLQNNCLIDTYREINPYRQQFTWNRNTSASRLDQIWITTNPT